MEEDDLENFQGFRHRTFNQDDCTFFIRALRRIYRDGQGLYSCFLEGYRRNRSIREAILNFRFEFLKTDHSPRSTKHLPDPSGNSAAKRINLFLRWMVRSGERGVDFGLWNEIDPADLLVPLSHQERQQAVNAWCRWICIPRTLQGNWDSSSVARMTGRRSRS